MIRPPTISPLFPYTTLFRSKGGFVELDQRTLGVLLEMTHARGPRDREHHGGPPQQPGERNLSWRSPEPTGDRKSTRLNSSHANISYAVFCLKKKTAEMDLVR